jgi:hypothetical protein
VETGVSNMEQTARNIDRPIDEVASRVPAAPYIAMVAASIVASAALFATGKRMAALFVGLWAPTVLNMGVYNKLLQVRH